MDDKTYLKLERKIDVLVKKKSRIHFYNENSTTAMLDMHGIKACEKAEKRAKRHNERARERIKNYNNLIAEILLLMVSYGYSLDNITNKYDMSEIINQNPVLSSHIEGNVLK